MNTKYDILNVKKSIFSLKKLIFNYPYTNIYHISIITTMGCSIIKESNVASVERFGKYDRIIHPGFHCYNCCTETVSVQHSIKVLTYEHQIETVTKESLSINIKVGFQFKINSDRILETNDLENIELSEKTKLLSYSAPVAYKDPIYLAIYSTHSPLAQMKQHISTYFRAVSCNYTMNELFLSKNKLSNELLKILNKEMIQYGYIILNVLILDIDPPLKVKETMNMVLASQNKRDATLNEAEADKKVAIMKAEGLCEVRRLEGVGLAKQRQAVVNGLKDSIGEFCDGQKLDPRELTSTIITMQYLDMLKDAANHGKNTFILSSNPSAANSIEEQLRNAILSTK